MATRLLDPSADNVHHRSVLVGREPRPGDWTPAPSPDLRARLASGRATAAALVPLIADVVAAHREALGVLAAAAPADVDIVDFDRAWRSFTAESGADGLRRVLTELGDLIASAGHPQTSAPLGTRMSD